MTYHLKPTSQGYIAIRDNMPAFVVERCPDDMKDQYSNVVALSPVRQVTHDEVEILIEELVGMTSADVSMAQMIVAMARQTAEDRKNGKS